MEAQSRWTAVTMPPTILPPMIASHACPTTGGGQSWPGAISLTAALPGVCHCGGSGGREADVRPGLLAGLEAARPDEADERDGALHGSLAALAPRLVTAHTLHMRAHRVTVHPVRLYEQVPELAVTRVRGIGFRASCRCEWRSPVRGTWREASAEGAVHSRESAGSTRTSRDRDGSA